MTASVLALDHFDLMAGSQACLLDQLDELHRRGHEVTVTRACDERAQARLDQQPDWRHLPLFPYLTKQRPGPAALRDLHRLRTHAKDCDCLLANSFPGLLTGMLIKRKQQTLLFQSHRIDFGYPHLTLLRLANPDQILAVSDTCETHLRSLGFPPDQVALVGNGFPLGSFSSLPLPGADPNKPLTVGLIARLHREKGVEEFIDLGRQLSGEAIRFRLVGPIVDPALVPIVEQGCRAGLVEHQPYSDNLGLLYEKLDVVANLSRVPETFGRTVIEGALFGRPAIVLARGHTPNLIKDQLTGRIANDLAQFASHLRQLAGTRCLLPQMGQAAREDAIRQHGLTAVVDRLEACLKERRRDRR